MILGSYFLFSQASCFSFLHSIVRCKALGTQGDPGIENHNGVVPDHETQNLSAPQATQAAFAEALLTYVSQ